MTWPCDQARAVVIQVAPRTVRGGLPISCLPGWLSWTDWSLIDRGRKTGAVRDPRRGISGPGARQRPVGADRAHGRAARADPGRPAADGGVAVPGPDRPGLRRGGDRPGRAAGRPGGRPGRRRARRAGAGAVRARPATWAWPPSSCSASRTAAGSANLQVAVVFDTLHEIAAADGAGSQGRKLECWPGCSARRRRWRPATWFVR